MAEFTIKKSYTLKVTMLYKIIHNLASHYPIPSTSHTRHHNFTYQLSYSRINSHLYSFFSSTIRLWNKLDYESVNKSSLQQFKTIYYMIMHCNCIHIITCTPHLICIHTHHALVVICVVHVPFKIHSCFAPHYCFTYTYSSQS